MKSVLLISFFFCIATFANNGENNVCTITTDDKTKTWTGMGATVGMAYDQAVASCAKVQNFTDQTVAKKVCQTLSVLCI